MIFTLTDSQVKEQREEMVGWLNRALNQKHGISIHNMLLHLRYILKQSPKYSWNIDGKEKFKSKSK